MQCTLRAQLTQFGQLLQSELFPVLERQLGALTEGGRRLTAVLAMIPLARFIPVSRGWNGRPAKDRQAIACAFVAKSVYNLATTRELIERLHEFDFEVDGLVLKVNRFEQRERELVRPVYLERDRRHLGGHELPDAGQDGFAVIRHLRSKDIMTPAIFSDSWKSPRFEAPSPKK